MNLKFIALAFGFAATVCSSAASAALVHVTYTGNVASTGHPGSGTLTGGYFGDVTSLLGFEFRSDYVFDTSLGTITTTPTMSSNSGGFSLGGQSPALSASITINGFTQQFSPNTGELRAGGGGQIYDNSYALAASYIITNNVCVRCTVLTNLLYANGFNTGEIPASNDIPFSYTTNDPYMFGSGNFTVYLNGNVVADLYLQTASVTVSLADAVPEPSTWAMMLLGFVGVGFMAYRRRNQTVALAT